MRGVGYVSCNYSSQCRLYIEEFTDVCQRQEKMRSLYKGFGAIRVEMRNEVD